MKFSSELLLLGVLLDFSSAAKRNTAPNQSQNEEVDAVVKVGDVVAQAVIDTQQIQVDDFSSGAERSEMPPHVKQSEPYLNNYQVKYQPYALKNQQYHSLDILGSSDMNERPTLGSLAQYGDSVTTPEELLDMCCQYPACYDPLYDLCIDTCRKCETVYPVTSWLPCPPLLNIPDCTSPNLSYAGSLPLACYPDIGPFGNIIPLESILAASRSYSTGRHGGSGAVSVHSGQAYRRTIRDGNVKVCAGNGICRRSGEKSGSIWG